MESTQAVTALTGLAQVTRLAIFRVLVRQGREGLAAGQIAAALKLAPATLSFHLRELSSAGLIRARQQSRFIYYSADFQAMNALIGYLSENCCGGGNADSTPSGAGCAPACPPEHVPPLGAPAVKPVIHPKRKAA